MGRKLPEKSEWVKANLTNLDAVENHAQVLIHYCWTGEALRRSLTLWLKLYLVGLFSLLNIFLHLFPLWIVGAPWQGYKRFKLLRGAWEVLHCEVECPSCRQTTLLERQVLERFLVRDMCKRCDRVIVINVPPRVIPA